MKVYELCSAGSARNGGVSVGGPTPANERN